MNRNRTRHRRRIGLRAAALIALTALFAGAAPAAHAAPANINPNVERSLTLVKHTSPTVASAPTGDGGEWAGPPEGAAPLEGVTLRIRQVTQLDGAPLDLMRTESWEALRPYLEGSRAFDPAAPGTMLAEGSEKDTAADGSVTWRGAELPLGAYWVTETAPGLHYIVDPIVPFLITVPAPTTTPGTWNYDVHAYPKNTVATADKTVDDWQAHALGDLVEWIITAEIPANPSHGVNLTEFSIVDHLPTGVRYEDGTAEPIVAEHALQADPRQLDPREYTIEHVDGTVTMRLTADGLDNVGTAIARTSGKLVFSFKTRLVGLGDANGTLRNEAEVTINQARIPVEAETLVGPPRIIKHAAGDRSKLLDGAEFQLFLSEREAQAASVRVADRGAIEHAVSVLVDGEMRDTFVTGAAGIEGEVLIPGLKASAEGISYWVVETRAPAGYQRQADVYEVVVTAQATPEGTATVTVENEQVPPLELPPTGSIASTIAITLAAALFAGAIVFAVIATRARMRRERAEA